MANSSSTEVDFGENLDEILEFLDEEFFLEDEIGSSCLESVAEKAEKEIKSFPCTICPKICKSKQGLSRHVNTTHKANTDTMVNKAHEKLDPKVYWKLVNDASAKFSCDDCYPPEIKLCFGAFSWTQEEADISYQFIQKIILDFNGNGEKFYPSFYNVFLTEPMFPRLGHLESRMLGREVANHVLAHLTSHLSSPLALSSTTPSLSLTPATTSSSKTFTIKEQNVICYLSGFVFHTIHKRLSRPSSSKSSSVKEKYLALLIAAKKTSNKPNSNERLLAAKDRGGLWTMSPCVVSIFEDVESFYRDHVISVNSTTKIDADALVEGLMKHPHILSLWSILRQKCSLHIEKELSLNLLQDIFMLYVRARTFSYVKQRKDNYRLQNKKMKERSLRTTIKKSSSSLEMGH